MNDGIIQASYIWTVEEFLAASEVNIRRQNPPIIIWSLRSVGLMLAIAGGCVLASVKEMDWAGTKWGGATLLMAGFALLWGTWIPTRIRPLRQAFQKAGAMAQADQKITFVIDEARIRKLTAGSESSWVWELVPWVIEAPGGYLIDHGGVGHWLPNHAFTDQDDREAFATLAQRRAVKFVSRIRKVQPDPFSS